MNDDENNPQLCERKGGNNGIEKLVKKFREEFRKENEGLYSKKDYIIAEKKYVKHKLGETCGTPN